MENPDRITLSAESVNLRMQKGNHASHEHVASMQKLSKLMTLLDRITEHDRTAFAEEFGFDGVWL